MAEEQKGHQQPTFMQIVRHPVTYALIVVVSVFWFVLYYVTGSKDTQIEREAKLYEMVIEEVRKQVPKEVSHQVKPIADKVDTISVTADSTFKKINSRMR